MSNLENSAVATELERRAMPKNVQTTIQFHMITRYAQNLSS